MGKIDLQEELNANGMAQWLENYGVQYGWVEVTAKKAQAGGSNFDYKSASSVYGQGKAMDKIKYYTHK